MERIGTDGSFDKAVALLKDLDGKVDAIGLGGIDIYLFADGRRYMIRDAARLLNAVTKTPVVDGSGLKNTLERQAISLMVAEGLSVEAKSTLMVSAVDRFGMAEALHDAGARIVYGDLIFGLGIPLAIRSFATFRVVARSLLPIVVKMPFTVLYPTGSKQEKPPEPRFERYYRESDIIAGDFLLVRRFMPEDMSGKWVITNTVTANDVDDLRRRGVEYLVTTTPEYEGRSFGTNVMEAAFVALLEKPWDAIDQQDYLDLLEKLDYRPRIERLSEAA